MHTKNTKKLLSNALSLLSLSGLIFYNCLIPISEYVDMFNSDFDVDVTKFFHHNFNKEMILYIYTKIYNALDFACKIVSMHTNFSGTPNVYFVILFCGSRFHEEKRYDQNCAS